MCTANWKIVNRQFKANSRLYLPVLFALFLLFSTYSICFAANVQVQWDAVSDANLAGYHVYYQANSNTQPFTGAGATPIDVVDATTTTISGLNTADVYYFAVTSYDTSGAESSYSNIASIQIPPTLTAFTMPATSASTTVAVTSLAATDNVGVTGYMITATSTEPTATASGWSSTPPASFTFSGTGSQTVYAWAKNAAGNVSTSLSATVSITATPDTTPPTISLTSPANGATVSGTVTISASASDNVGVTAVNFYENGTLLFATNTTPYSYKWNTTTLTNGSYTLSAKASDAAGNVGTSSNVTVTVFNDTTPPTVTSFTMPATATATTVAVTSFTATDNVGVTGYIITGSSAAPSATSSGWSSSPPSSYTFSGTGSQTAYAWAKDASGNVSASLSANVAITLPDTTPPTVTAFKMPATSTSLTVPVTSFSATDNVGVTGYLITASSTAPSASASGWTASAPTSFTFSAAGSQTAYAWAEDAAGNVSSSRSAIVAITLPDTTPPTVTAFTMPSTSTSLTVPVTSFSATDNVGVTGYLITASSVAPSASASGWTASAPTSFTFSAAGSVTAYAWAKDAAGNVSAGLSANVAITLPDTTPPTVTAFTMPSTSTSLTVPVTSFSATDNVGVTGYLITASSAVPSASSSGWTASPPTSITFSAAGSVTAYAWAKDAAGNVSSSLSAGITIALPVAAAAPYTINDALTAMQIADGTIQPTSAQMTRLDVAPFINGVSQPNGIIDMGDVLVILEAVAGTITL